MNIEKGVDWRNYAACLYEDPELFFPKGNTGPAILQIEEAKKVCLRCDVRSRCLEWALEAGQDHGVWGGLSEDERRALRRRNARVGVREQRRRDREEADRAASEAAANQRDWEMKVEEAQADVDAAYGSYDEPSPSFNV